MYVVCYVQPFIHRLDFIVLSALTLTCLFTRKKDEGQDRIAFCDPCFLTFCVACASSLLSPLFPLLRRNLEHN
jgi:hypothetical protein